VIIALTPGVNEDIAQSNHSATYQASLQWIDGFGTSIVEIGKLLGAQIIIQQSFIISIT
jgi:hypothetical protein